MSSAGVYLDSEWTVASIASAGILVAAALAAFALAGRRVSWRGLDWPVAGLGLFFAYMAVDELFELHERFDVWLGPAGVALFVPILLIGFSAWLLTRRRLRALARYLFTLAAATWLGAQMLELIANPPAGPGVGRSLFVYPEELGEAVGSALFAAALVLAFARTPRPWRARAFPQRAGIRTYALALSSRR